MKEIRSEADFQDSVVAMFKTGGINVQRHQDKHENHIPDLSAACMGRDYWIELKYDVFQMEREYDYFKWSKSTAGQLDWLHARQSAGGARCVVLGFARTGPQDLINWVICMTAAQYRNTVADKQSIGAVLLSHRAERWDSIHGGVSLLRFINRAVAAG